MLGIDTAYIADMEVRNECLYNAQPKSSHQNKTSEQCQQQVYQCNLKLPDLEISVFDGDKIKWREFWDFFKVTVDQNKWLSEIERFCWCSSNSMEERKFNVQQENKNLEKELSEVSALTKFNHKLHESKCQSRCVAPPWNFKVAQDSTKNMLHFDNKQHTCQISEKGTGFEKLSAEGLHFKENKPKENFLSICKDTFTTHAFMKHSLAVGVSWKSHEFAYISIMFISFCLLNHMRLYFYL